MRRLAVGGTAEILLARLAGGEPVVIKRLLPDAPNEMLDRLRREADILAAIAAPNVVRLVGREARQLVLEYVDGLDTGALSIRLAKRGEALPLSATIMVGLALARALTVIHSAGFVHADISPSNVLVRRDGVVKLVDLGVARRTDEGPPRGPEGTLAYQPPEQLALGEIDGRADIYASGLLLYELSTGTPARPAGQLGLAELRTARMQRLAPPSVVRPGLPTEFDEVLYDVLDPDPTGRPSAVEWLHRLERLYADPEPLRALISSVIGAPVPSARTTAAPSAEPTALLDSVGPQDRMAPIARPPAQDRVPLNQPPTLDRTPLPRPDSQGSTQPSPVPDAKRVARQNKSPDDTVSTIDTGPKTTKAAPMPVAPAQTSPGRPWSSTRALGETQTRHRPASALDDDTQARTHPGSLDVQPHELSPTRQVSPPPDESEEETALLEDMDPIPDDPFERRERRPPLMEAPTPPPPAMEAPPPPADLTPLLQYGPSSTHRRRSINWPLVIAVVAAAFAFTAYFQVRRLRSTKPVIAVPVALDERGAPAAAARLDVSPSPADASAAAQEEVPASSADARAQSQEPVGGSVNGAERGSAAPEAPSASVVRSPKRARRRRSAEPRRVRLRVGADRGVRVRGGGIDGTGTQTTAALPSGATLLRLTAKGLSVDLRVQRTGTAVSVTIGAPAGTYYNVECGDRPPRWTPLVDLKVDRRVNCHVADGDNQVRFWLMPRTD